MITARLPRSASPTTALGFGCSALTGGASRRGGIRLVHAACDAGIRHFDVAPPYGMGTAEDVLGEALESRRHVITLATKVGIARPRRSGAIVALRSLAAPLRKALPGLTRRAGASAYRTAATRKIFDVPSTEASLAESLRRLRTDYVDLLLLHEVDSDDLTDELLACLEALRRKGVVRAIGTGTSYANTVAIQGAYPDFFDVWQYSWSVLDWAQPKPVAFSITHRAIQRALSPLRDWLGADAARIRRLSEATGIDLSAKRELGFVLIGAAMMNNPGGITLVSSRQPSHIEANARQLSDRGALDTAARFVRALAAEPDVPQV